MTSRLAALVAAVDIRALIDEVLDEGAGLGVKFVLAGRGDEGQEGGLVLTVVPADVDAGFEVRSRRWWRFVKDLSSS
jgi:hypothetical protein